MKAIWGKLSIACSGMSLILWVAGLTVTVTSMIHSFKMLGDVGGLESGVLAARISRGLFAMFVAVRGGFLLIPFGFLFCYLSVRKQEAPKHYRYIGFFLTLAACLLLLSSVLGSHYHYSLRSDIHLYESADESQKAGN